MAFSISSLSSMDGFLASPRMLFLLFVLIVAPLLYWRRIRRGRTWPKYHAVRGTVIHQMVNFRRLYDYHTELSHRSKTFRILTSPFHSVVYTNDPAVIEHILASNFKNYGKGQYIYEILSDLVGEGIFSVDGEGWRFQRKLASYEFSTRTLRDCSTLIFKKNCVRLSGEIARFADSNEEIDLQEFLKKSMMDSISEVSLGVELNTLQGTDAETREFARALDESSEIVNWRYVNLMWKLMRFLDLGSESRLKKNVRILDEFALKLIRSRSDQFTEKTGEKHDILSRFLSERQRHPESLSDRYLRDIVICFIFAGKDAPASTLSWFIYLLCEHPDVEKKVVDEIRVAVGASGSRSFEEFAAKIDDESMKKMTYLHATLTETLRLYPVISMNGKICFSDDTLPDGYSVRAGEFIFYQPYCMGRMKSLWGEDAEKFRPERWLDADGKFCPESPFKFSAFQAGPRICLGKDFAYRQMKIYAALLLHSFSFKLRAGESVHYRMTVTMFMTPGLNVRVFRR